LGEKKGCDWRREKERKKEKEMNEINII